ncbi:MAG: ComEC/Rec2 family competence protein [Patescibacteria group bacterium]
MITPSKILFFICLSFVAGIFFESSFGISQDKLIKIPQIFLWAFLFVAVFIIVFSLLIKKENFTVIGFCIFLFLVGILRMQISEFNIANDKLRQENDKGQITLTGIIIREPDVRNASQKLKIDVSGSVVLATTSRYPEYKYLDKVKIIGQLKTPSETEDFNYKNYLLKDRIYSVMDFPKISVLGGPASGGEKINPTVIQKLYSGILFFKQKLRESIRNNFSPPESLILEGTILGDSGAMDQDLKNKLNITGLRHIIAVSGTHIVILSSILVSLFLAFGLWRGQAFYFSVIFIWFYILLTGLPQSGIRAGIMGSIFLLAQKLGRQNTGSRAIVLAGAIMLLKNPLLLLYDVGFQLSFLAVLGLIYLEPLIKDFIKIFTRDKAKNFVSIISATFAAQIFTLPIMIYNFGNISLVSPITNILILPIVSLLMFFGFFSAILGVFSNILGWIVSFPCLFLLNYFVKVIDIFSKPFAVKYIENVSLIWVIIFYLVLTVIVAHLNRVKREKFLG